MGHHIGDHGFRRLRHDAASPVGLGQPVAKVGGLAEDALADLEAEAADGLALDLDGPVRRFGHAGNAREPGIRVSLRVGVREHVGEVAPDVAVVGRVHERGLVARRPVAHDALRTLESHLGDTVMVRLTSGAAPGRGASRAPAQ